MLARCDTKRGDLNVIQVGAQRTAVITEFGMPDSFSTLEDGGYEDRYKLDPDAHGSWAKAFTGLFYVAADIFTLCLTELIFTPMEIAFRDKLVIHHLIYNPDQKLSTVEKIKP